MSTRAMIAVRESWNGALRLFYRHCDGYPSGLGAELIAEMKRSRDLAGVLSAVDAKDEGKLAHKISDIYPGCQGDLEWIYVLDATNWSLAIVKTSNPHCDKRFTWLAWFSYARYFPQDHEAEMARVEATASQILHALAAFESDKEVMA